MLQAVVFLTFDLVSHHFAWGIPRAGEEIELFYFSFISNSWRKKEENLAFHLPTVDAPRCREYVAWVAKKVEWDGFFILFFTFPTKVKRKFCVFLAKYGKQPSASTGDVMSTARSTIVHVLEVLYCICTRLWKNVHKQS
jgi:hypothetical protein